jgi:ankyrin repeat protein
MDMPLDVSDRFGQTPLHIASERSLEMTTVLLEAGASVNLEDNAGINMINTYKLVRSKKL